MDENVPPTFLRGVDGCQGGWLAVALDRWHMPQATMGLALQGRNLPSPGLTPNLLHTSFLPRTPMLFSALKRRTLSSLVL